MPLKVTIQLARHSDPKLTLGVYAQIGISDLDSAATAVPEMTDPSTDRKVEGQCFGRWSVSYDWIQRDLLKLR